MKKLTLLIFILVGIASIATPLCAQTHLSVTKDLSVEGDLSVDRNVLVVSSASGLVGVNTSHPTEELHVEGDLSIDGSLTTAAIFFDDGAELTGSNWLLLADGTGTQAITAATVTLNLDVEVYVGPAYSVAADVVTFNESGTYLVYGIVGTNDTNTTGGNRSTMIVQLEEDTGGGFTDVPMGAGYGYQRETTDSNGLVFAIHTWNAGDQLRVGLRRITGSTNFETLANRCSLAKFSVSPLFFSLILVFLDNFSFS